MKFTRKNQGVCSTSTTVEIENGVIQSVSVLGGCDGNLKGICALLPGTSAEQAIERLQGITCRARPTSCPAQIALCIEDAIKQALALDAGEAAIETQSA